MNSAEPKTNQKGPAETRITLRNRFGGVVSYTLSNTHVTKALIELVIVRNCTILEVQSEN